MLAGGKRIPNLQKESAVYGNLICSFYAQLFLDSYRIVECNKVWQSIPNVQFLMHAFRGFLPHSALSRVFFPTQEELVQYFTPLSLPKG